MEYKLSDLFDLQMGKTPDRHIPEYWADGTEQWISIADLSKCDKYIEETAEAISEQAVNDSGIKIIPASTVIMSFKLSIGKVAITPKPMYSNEAIMAFIDKGVIPIEPTYLYFLLKAKDWDEGTNKAVMGKTLNKATLSQVKVHIHDLAEQRKIIRTLEKAESMVTTRRQQLTALDTLIKARFVEMFGDPISNPKGWDSVGLLELGSCKNGMNFHTDDAGVEVHCLGVGDFKDKSVISDTSVLPLVSLNEMPLGEYLLQDGDIVFVRSNGNKALVGRCLAVFPGQIQTTFSGFCIRFRKRSHKVTTEYLIHVLKTESMRKKMQGRGANIQNLNQQILGSLSIPVPPVDMQNRFSECVYQVDKSKAVVQAAHVIARNLHSRRQQKCRILNF